MLCHKNPLLQSIRPCSSAAAACPSSCPTAVEIAAALHTSRFQSTDFPPHTLPLGTYPTPPLSLNGSHPVHPMPAPFQPLHPSTDSLTCYHIAGQQGSHRQAQQSTSVHHPSSLGQSTCQQNLILGSTQHLAVFCLAGNWKTLSAAEKHGG